MCRFEGRGVDGVRWGFEIDLAWNVCIGSGDDGACEVYTEIKRVSFFPIDDVDASLEALGMEKEEFRVAGS